MISSCLCGCVGVLFLTFCFFSGSYESVVAVCRLVENSYEILIGVTTGSTI